MMNRKNRMMMMNGSQSKITSKIELPLGAWTLEPPGRLLFAACCCRVLASCGPWLPTQDACSGWLPFFGVIWMVWVESISRADLTCPLSIMLTTVEVSAALYEVPELA